MTQPGRDQSHQLDVVAEPAGQQTFKIGRFTVRREWSRSVGLGHHRCGSNVGIASAAGPSTTIAAMHPVASSIGPAETSTAPIKSWLQQQHSTVDELENAFSSFCGLPPRLTTSAPAKLVAWGQPRWWALGVLGFLKHLSRQLRPHQDHQSHFVTSYVAAWNRCPDNAEGLVSVAARGRATTFEVLPW